MIFKIPIPTYHDKGAVWVLFCSDIEAEEFKRKRKYKNMNLNFIDSEAFTISNGFNCVLRFKKDPIDTPHLVAHELLHAVFHIHRYAGVTPSEATEEAYSYFLSYLIREFHKQYNKAKKDADRRDTDDSTPTQSSFVTSIHPIETTT